MNRIKSARFTRRQRGLAVVELAFVTPVLLVIMLVSAEFTKVFYDYNTLTKSVRDSARFLSSGAINSARVVDIADQLVKAKNLAVSGTLTGGTPLLTGLTTNQITIEVLNLGGGAVGIPHIRVSASYAYQPITPVISGMGFLTSDFGMNFQLNAQSTMRAI